jgi:hypothetical protein
MAGNIERLKFLLLAKNNDEIMAKLRSGDTSPIDAAPDLSRDDKAALKGLGWSDLEIDLNEQDIADFASLGEMGHGVRSSGFVKHHIEEFFS